jgi:uncharacterized protein YjbI with pentapeptide repeats
MRASNVRASRALLQHALFYYARLEGAYLTRANLEDAGLVKADLTDAIFGADSFTDINLKAADLADARLDRARLGGVDLREVVGLSQAQIDAAIIDESTRLPEHLHLPIKLHEDGANEESQ